MKVKCDHRSKFSNLSNWKEEAGKKKNQGFNGIRTHDLRDTGAMLYQQCQHKVHYINYFHHIAFVKHSVQICGGSSQTSEISRLFFRRYTPNRTAI